MITRPGLGKWLGFLREVRSHFKAEEANSAIPQLYAFLDRHHHGKRGTRIVLHDGANRIRQDTLSALVTLRNRWAHSKSLEPEAAAVLAPALQIVVRHLFRDLALHKDCPLLLSAPNTKAMAAVGATLPELPEDLSQPVDVLLGLPRQPGSLTRLVLQRKGRKGKPEILLFEELIEKRHALYSSSFDSVRLSASEPDGRPVIQSLLDLIESVRAENETLTLQDTTWERFQRRCNAFTFETYANFLESGKYDPRTYLPHEEMEKSREAWWECAASILIIDAPQGTGKSALACHWAAGLAGWDSVEESEKSEPDLTPSAVLLFEAHRFNAYSEVRPDFINRTLCEALQLDVRRPWTEYLRSAIEDAPSDSRCLIIFDAVNEFQTMPGGWTRRRLLESILQLSDLIASIDPDGRQVKLLLTLRWEMFVSDGYEYQAFVETQAMQGRTERIFTPDSSTQTIVRLPEPAKPEELYERFRHTTDGMRPAFEWDEIPPRLQTSLSNPLMLQLFLRAHSGKTKDEIRARTPRQLENEYLGAILLPRFRDSKPEKKARRSA